MLCLVSGNWRTDPCLVASNVRERVALQNKRSIMCVYLIIVHGKQLSTFMATFILSSSSAQYFYSCNFCYLLKMHFTVMWKDVCSKDDGYLLCKLVW